MTFTMTRACKQCGGEAQRRNALCRVCRAAYNLAYRAAHKAERAAYNAAYSVTHKAERSARSAANYAARRDDYRARKAAHRATHQADYAARSAAYRSLRKEELADYNARWAKAHLEHLAANQRRRRARIKNAEGDHTVDDVKRLFAIQKGKCAYLWCRATIRSRGYHVDHIVPLALGGSNDKRNIQLLCARCNFSKGAKHPTDYAQKFGSLL